MNIKKWFFVFFAAGLLVSPAYCGLVIAWVPPYSISACKTQLQKDFGGVGMKDGLTYLALQWWITNGPALKKDSNVPSGSFDTEVKWFVDWSHQYGIKALLCLDDYVGGWNWAEAVRSYKDNRAAFVKALVAEVVRLNLDGVDLDLEGPLEVGTADRDAYYVFAAELSDSMHARGKHVTVASFSAQWNAPNWNWWPTLFTKVDGIASMGYEQSGRATDYTAQRQHATTPEKFMIGMPGSTGNWLGNTVTEQIDWVVADGKVGVGIWDASLGGAGWETAAVWNRLKTIRQKSVTSSFLPVSLNTGKPFAMNIVQRQGRGIDIAITLPEKSFATATVYDVTGRHVQELSPPSYSKGGLLLHWDGTGSSGKKAVRGCYTLVVASVDGTSITRQFVLTK
jgi:hypothetical protein